MDYLRRTLVALLIASMGLAISGMPSMAKNLKVAAVFPGSITDQAGMQNSYEGLMKAKKTLKVETAYSEKVPQADQLEAMSDYARRGYDLVIGGGGEFIAAAKRVVERYPDTFVVVINGAPTEGVVTLNYNNQQFGYVLGLAAGRTTKTGKAGVVAAQPLKVVLDGIEGFKKGFEKGHPGGEVIVAYTNDFDDVAKAMEATLNQIAQGVDVVFPYLDNGIVGVMKAAKEKGVKAVAVWADLSKSWPEENLLSTVVDFGEYLVYTIETAMNGKLERRDYRMGIGTKMGYLSDFNPAVPADVKAEILQVIEDLKSGKLRL